MKPWNSDIWTTAIVYYIIFINKILIVINDWKNCVIIYSYTPNKSN